MSVVFFGAVLINLSGNFHGHSMLVDTAPLRTLIHSHFFQEETGLLLFRVAIFLQAQATLWVMINSEQGFGDVSTI